VSGDTGDREIRRMEVAYDFMLLLTAGFVLLVACVEPGYGCGVGGRIWRLAPVSSKTT
jgi:hypothetical protein